MNRTRNQFGPSVGPSKSMVPWELSMFVVAVLFCLLFLLALKMSQLTGFSLLQLWKLLFPLLPALVLFHPYMSVPSRI